MEPIENDSPKQYLVEKKGQEQIRKGLSSGKLNEALNSFRLDNRLDICDSDALYWLVSKLNAKESSFQYSVMQNFCNLTYERIKILFENSNSSTSYQLIYDENNQPVDTVRTKINSYIQKLVQYSENVEMQRLILRLSDLISVESIPLPIIAALKNNQELYKECSSNLKNILWKQDSDLLLTELKLLLNDYCSDSALNELSREMSKQDIKKFVEIRRDQPHLKRLVDIIKNDLFLYNKVIEAAEEIYKQSNILEICLFRLDFIMAMHYHDMRKSAESDPVYSLAWAIDASLSKQHIEPKRVKELERILENNSTNIFVLRSLSLICNSAAVRHLLAQSCWHIIHSSKTKQSIVSNTELWWLLEIISFGANAPQMFESNVFLMSMIENDIQGLCIEIYDFENGNIGVADFKNLFLLKTSEAARQLIYKTLLHFIETKRLDGFEAFLSIIWECYIELCSKTPISNSADLLEISLEQNSNFVRDKNNNICDIRTISGLTNNQLRPSPENVHNILKFEERVPWVDYQVKYLNSTFEYECFVQSLVTIILNSNYLMSNILNTTRYSSILGFFEKFAQVNSFGHLQSLRLVAGLLSTLSNQLAHTNPNKSTNDSIKSLDVNITNLLSTDTEMLNDSHEDQNAIIDKQGSAYFLFIYSQKLASYGCITLDLKKQLYLAYEKLILSSSPLLFNYRITKTNSPIIASVLNQLS
ncbi:hypothetical protein BB561_001903 [Smittium simulii]|uniref:Uncharacterized protein n=1 Tax=Smittium simulii TaxID=133385 RepID=A0A2T9YSK0_9FUNG|nr:hypothetical protein BB561_001903 [Smittium simulii]